MEGYGKLTKIENDKVMPSVGQRVKIVISFDTQQFHERRVES